MIQNTHPYPIHKITLFSAAGIRAAFFVPFFTVVIVVTGLIFRQNTATADSVPLAETLGIQIVELDRKQETGALEVALKSKGISEHETIAIAKELYEEQKQQVVVFATSQPVNEATPASYHEGMEYKVTIKDEVVESIDFDVYREVLPAQIEKEWDLSQNVLDLMTGKVTVDIQMDEHWTKETILAKAQALSTLIIANNQSSGVASVFFNIQVREKKFVFYSKHFNTLGEYQLIAL